MKRFVGHPRGLATLLAIFLLGWITLTVAILAQEFRIDARRSQLSSQDAQLRQLLLAGAEDASVRSIKWGDSPPAQPWTIALPTVLSGNLAKLTAYPLPQPDGTVDVRLEAQLDDQQRAEVLHLRKVNDKWLVSSVSFAK